jgi:hypothetical protein
VILATGFFSKESKFVQKVFFGKLLIFTFTNDKCGSKARFQKFHLKIGLTFRSSSRTYSLLMTYLLIRVAIPKRVIIRALCACSAKSGTYATGVRPQIASKLFWWTTFLISLKLDFDYADFAQKSMLLSTGCNSASEI